MTNKTLSIILPCFNEEKNIPFILESFYQVIKRDDIEVIIVDNGSKDNTAKLLKDLIPKYSFAKSIRVELNKGYGYGIISGLRVAKGNYLGWTHADMQTNPKDILKAFSLIEEHNFSSNIFVKGLRRNRKSSELFFSVGMSIFSSIILLTPLWDINAQPNIFSRELFDNCSNAPYDFSFDLYYYFLALKKNYRIIRFDVKFEKRLYGHSNWNINWKSKLQFIFRNLIYILKLRSKRYN